MIEQRKFGKVDAQVGVLGLGTVKFGRNAGVKYPGGDGFALPSDADIEKILDLCVEYGVNLIDTAPAYGVAEERLGAVMGARREKFFISTKAGEEFDGKNAQYIFTADHTRMSVERSLKRLRTDVIDCVLVHCNRDDEHVLTQTPVFETLAQLKAEGKIRSFGASTYTVAGGTFAAQNADAVMVAFNSAYREEEAVIDAAAKAGAAVLVKKALSSGHAVDPAAEIRLVAGRAGVTSAVIGSRNPVNILSNIKALLNP